MSEEKQTVREFYETFGWRKTDTDVYRDAATFVDRRPILNYYRRKTDLRLRRFLKAPGELFLDAGSGANPSVNCSSGFKRHICVDLSITGLTEARLKLGARGSFVMADLTSLPFRHDVFDAILCAHVLYHIPKDEQEAAVLELYRALRKGGRCVILYHKPEDLPKETASRFGGGFVASRLRRRVRAPLTRLIDRLTMRMAKTFADDRLESEEPSHPPLYFYAHDCRWFRERLPASWDIDIRCWRAVDRKFTTTFVRRRYSGHLLTRLIYRLEETFPHLMARIGSYPMIIIRKT